MYIHVGFTRVLLTWLPETVPAPPTAFRRDGLKSKTKITTGGLDTTCSTDKALLGGCTDPGYKLQWPYIQMSTAETTQVVSTSVERIDVLRAS